MRPSWDEFFMNVAVNLKTRSTCLRRQVGAVLVAERRILATGYNGSPPGDEHCSDIGCLRQTLDIPSGERHEICRAVHAEQNLLVQLAKHGTTWPSSACVKVYCTTFPCYICAKLLVSIGVKEIYYIDGYPDKLSEELLKRMNVRCIQMKL
jgi:dCMP deaminase